MSDKSKNNNLKKSKTNPMEALLNQLESMHKLTEEEEKSIKAGGSTQPEIKLNLPENGFGLENL